MSDQKSTFDPKTFKIPESWQKSIVPPAIPPAVSPLDSKPLEAANEPLITPPKAVESGEQLQVNNAEFIKAVFPELADGTSPAVCTKSGDPADGRGWYAEQANAALPRLTDDRNNYLNCSIFKVPDDGALCVRKSEFAGLSFLLADDVGTKVPLDCFGEFQPTWKIETSPGNYQCGFVLATPITDVEEAERLQKALLSAGLGDKGASGVSRWARLPNAINGKEKYKADGQSFRCRLAEWNPKKRYTPEEIVSGLRLQLAEKKVAGSKEARDHEGDDVFSPSAAENPVITELKARGLYKTALGSGKHDVTCPWVHEHTDELDSGTAYFEPNDEFTYGGFVCMHSHREMYKLQQLLAELNITRGGAMNRPIIRVVQGEIHRIVDVAERELARREQHYQAGGLIVDISIEPSTGNPSIAPLNNSMLTRVLAETANWEKYDARAGRWCRCDPPPRHVSILSDSKTYNHLPPLSGLARQPFFRECDGELVTQAGYDTASKLFGVFDPCQFEIPDPTREVAEEALALLLDLLSEFRFASDIDRSAALSAIFTAVVRTALPFAPAFHVRAPASGSGKSYLCDLIGAFAGPAGSAKVSFPKTSEEATKVLLSLLLTNPAVIEFDDMDSDWIPHGVINRSLTAEYITDRILGVSKTATVSTRSLFLGSGNNVGPVRDLMRRVLTINIDSRCATPATIAYTGNPVRKVREQRGRYVAAVLTIIQAWKAAGSPRAEVENIVTYGGAWADYCRHPLIWLGLADPASALLDQVKHDPDAENLGRLLGEWHKKFGSKPMTVRKVLRETEFDEELMDAIREFPVEERGGVNRSKFGWILKKNANRIVNGLMFQQATADGRTAWMVVEVSAT